MPWPEGPSARALSGQLRAQEVSHLKHEAEAEVAFVSHRACFHHRVKKRNTFLLSMRFMDPEMETRYSVEKEKQSGAAFSCSCVVLLCTALVEILIDPW